MRQLTCLLMGKLLLVILIVGVMLGAWRLPEIYELINAIISINLLYISMLSQKVK